MKKLLITSIILLLSSIFSFAQDNENDIRLAIGKYKSGDATGALVILDSLIDVNSKDTLSIKYKYQICFYSNKIDEGFKAIQQIYSFTEACVNFGNLYFVRKDYSNAIIYYNKAIEANSNYVDAIFNRGICYRHQFLIKKAVDDFELALKIKPDYMQVYNSLGNLYSSQLDYKKAIKTYEKALKIDVNYKEAYYNKGLVQYKQGKFDDAIQSLDKALTIDPTFKEALYNRALSKLRSKNNKEGACDDLKKAYTLGYENALTTLIAECP